MRLSEQPRVNVGVTEHRCVLPRFYDDAAAGVQEKLAPLASEESLRGDASLYPRHALSPRSTEELFGHTRAATAGACKLTVECVIRFLRGRKLVNVSLDRYSGDGGVEFLDGTPTSNEVLKRLRRRHVRKVARC